MNNKLLSKICATLLSFMMVVSFMPYQVFATDEQPVDTGETVEENQDTDVIAEEPAVEEPAAPEAAESAAEENSEPADTAEEPKQELKEEPQDVEPLTFKTEKQSATPDVQLKDNDALLIEYLKKNISGEKLNLKTSRRNSLTKNEQLIYDNLKDQICDVAAGDETSTILYVPLSAYTHVKHQNNRWEITKEDLDVDEIIVNNNGSWELTDEASDAFDNEVDYSGTRIISALLYDLPYDFFWYDKTAMFEYIMLPYNYNADANAFYFEEEPVLKFSLPVNKAYSQADAAGTYETDSDKIDAANTCIKTVSGIIEDNENKSDYDKVVSYKNAITSRVEYNYNALNNPVYGDPWQIIYVFDNDNSTNVVCEGYSKAFQFLCDMSALYKIRCSTVTGEMDGGTGAGAHMWNILSIKGKNYIADITNCDNGSAGYPDALFLKGAQSGDVSNGYEYPCGVTYFYDDVSFDLYSEEELTMSLSDFDPANDMQDDEYQLDIDDNVLYSDGSVIFSLPDSLEITGPLDIKVGKVDGNTWDELPSYAYNFDEEKSELCVFGDEVLDSGYSYNNVDVYIASPSDFWYAVGGIEFREARYDYDFEEDRDLLPGWDGSVNETYHVHLDTDEHRGEDTEYTVDSVDVISGEDFLEDFHEDSDENNKWWYYRAGSEGVVTLEIHYTDVWGASQSYELELNITDTVYELNLDSENGKDKILPGESLTLIAEGRVIEAGEDWEAYDGEYSWDVIEGDANLHEDGNCAEISMDSEGSAVIEVTIYTGQKYISRRYWVGCFNEYYEISPLRIVNLNVGETYTDDFVLYKYTKDGRTEVPAEFNWYYDDTRLNIENFGSSYEITRLSNDWAEAEIEALWGNNRESRRYTFDTMDYEFWMDSDTPTLYSDGEQYINLHYDYLKAEQLGYNVNVTAGTGDWGENGWTWDRTFDAFVNDDIVYINGSDAFAGEEENFRVVCELKYGDHAIKDCDYWGYVKEARIDYHFEENREMVANNDGMFIDKQREVYIENAIFPDGLEFPYNIINVEVAEEHPNVTNKHVVKIEAHEDGWQIDAATLGTALIRVTYKDVDDNEQTYDFTITVSEDVFEVYIDADNYIKYPGGEIALTANGIHRNADGESEDDLSYEWEVDTDYASIEGQGNEAVVTMLSLPANKNRENFQARVRMFYEGEEVATNTIDLCNANEYDEMHVDIPSEFDVGETIEITPEWRHYKGENYTVRQADYEVNYDLNRVLVERNGSTFSITRRVSYDFDIEIEATDGDESFSQRFHFNTMDYNGYFEGDDYIYSDEEKDIEFFGCENVDVNFRLEYGEWTDAGWSTKKVLTDGFDINGRVVTLDGSELEEGVLIIATISNNNYPIDKIDYYVRYEDVIEEYFDSDSLDIVPGEEIYINETDQAYVQNSVFPEGDFQDFEINNVTVDGNCVSLEEDEGWCITGLSYGTATATISYTDIHGDSQTFVVTINVLADVYEVYIDSPTDRLSPGESVNITAEGIHKTEDGEITEGFTYEWRIEGNGTLIPVGNAAVVTAGEDDEDDIEVFVTLSENGEVKAEDSFFIAVIDEFDEIEIDEVDEDLPVGSTVSLTPDVIHHPGDVSIDNVEFKFSYDNNVVIYDENGDEVGYDEEDYHGSTAKQTFELKRVGFDYSEIHIDAFWTDDFGYTQSEHYSFSLNPIEECLHEYEEPDYVWDGTSCTASMECIYDGYVITETVQATGVTLKPATCEEWGETLYTATFENEAFKKQTKSITDREPLGHDWADWSISPSTCTEKGLKTRVCLRDVSHKESQEIPIDSTAHDWGDWTVTTEAGCETTGVKTRVCRHNSSHTETDIVPAKGHTIITVAEVPSTCKVAGTAQHKECSVCHKLYDMNGNETTATALALPKLSHTWNNGEVTKAATCGATGIKTYTCTVCGDTKTETIPKLTTHTWDNGKATKAATCKETGIKTYTCTICGNTKTETIPKLTTHTWDNGKVTKAATCKETGIKTHTCTVCGETKTETIPKLTTHTWNNGTVTKAATCKETGVKTYTCTVCGTTKTEVIPKSASHTWNSGTVTKAATCKETGVKTYTCTVCGTTKTEIIPLAAHNLKHVNEVPATATSTGVKAHDECTVCHKKFINSKEVTDASLVIPVTIISLSGATVSLGNPTWTGRAQSPAVAVSVSGKTLRLNTDYTVKYSNNVNIGTASATITGKGNYSGSITKSFQILPKPASISTPKTGKKYMTVKWKKQTKKMPKARITGYQIQYSLDKTFSSGVKSTSVKGYKKTSKKISKLKSKRIYYVRVRTYIKVGGKTYYSNWSAVKAAKIK